MTVILVSADVFGYSGYDFRWLAVQVKQKSIPGPPNTDNDTHSAEKLLLKPS
jgi:hypothetical protein